MSEPLLPASGRFEGGTHVFPVRTYFEDCDPAGIVYHANYLRFAERARTEMMRALGVTHVGMLRTGVAFAVRRCEIDYLRPARLEEALEVRTRIIDIRGATLDAEQIVRRPDAPRNGPPDGADLPPDHAFAHAHDDEAGEGDMVRLFLRLACVNQNGRPVRIPSDVRTAIDRHQTSTASSRQS
ncbi:MAG TPA: YbgC/FadM family acyl-CoA thioesterase [Azospirillaceae bacterium]|nr:YbgC/FadM family acyl-CoA thioesterase [Azospirillaceae bacterium]